MLDAVFSLEFILKREHVLMVGPAGVGKSFLAQAPGYAAMRAGYTVRFIHADIFFRALARVDNSVGRTFLSPDLLILDDLVLHRLRSHQLADLYQLIICRHWVSSYRERLSPHQRMVGPKEVIDLKTKT